MKNWKSIITTICGVISLLGVILGIIIGVLQTYEVVTPVWLLIVAACCATIPTAVIGWASGRNADLSAKSPEQIAKQKEMSTPNGETH
jgi:galactitol-specific phosphotransferase system IIC component